MAFGDSLVLYIIRIQAYNKGFSTAVSWFQPYLPLGVFLCVMFIHLRYVCDASSSWKPTYVIKLDAQRWNSNRLTFRPLLDLEIDSFFFPFYFLQVSSPPCGPLRVGVAQMTTVSANSICTCTSVSRRHDVLWFGKESRFPLLCSFSLQVIFFSEQPFLWKLFDIRFSYRHCTFSRVCLLVN